MKKELSWVRRLQKHAIEAAGVLADKTSLALDEAKSGLKKLDDEHGITVKLKTTGDTISVLAQQADQRYDISRKASIAKNVATIAAIQARNTAIRVTEESGLNRRVSVVGDAIKTRVTDPAAELIRQYELDKRLQSLGHALEYGYGTALLRVRDRRCVLCAADAHSGR